MKACAALLALGLFAGCAPALTGAACLTDCNCPTQQRCAQNPDGGKGACAEGTNSCSRDGGLLDAGPSLFGKVTLNGGIRKPAGNLADVYAWSSSPLLDDGGLASALFSTTANADGTWELDQATAGSSYVVGVAYYLSQGQSPALAFSPQITADGTPLIIDVPTYVCTVWSLRTAAGLTTPAVLAGLIANVPDITTGAEVPDAGVTATQGQNTLTLVLGHTNDPLATGGYSWSPDSLAGGPPAVDNVYTFTINAPGYAPNTNCSVTNKSLKAVPASVMAPNPWDPLTDQVVSWIPPLETTVSFLTITNSQNTAIALPQSVSIKTHTGAGLRQQVTFPAGTPSTSDCPTPAQCTLTVLSLHAQVSLDPPGINEATAWTQIPFSTP